MTRDRVVYGESCCEDCGKVDQARGHHGRMVRHHDATGHEVRVTSTVVYKRASNPQQFRLNVEGPTSEDSG